MNLVIRQPMKPKDYVCWRGKLSDTELWHFIWKHLKSKTMICWHRGRVTLLYVSVIWSHSTLSTQTEWRKISSPSFYPRNKIFMIDGFRAHGHWSTSDHHQHIVIMGCMACKSEPSCSLPPLCFLRSLRWGVAPDPSQIYHMGNGHVPRWPWRRNGIGGDILQKHDTKLNSLDLDKNPISWLIICVDLYFIQSIWYFETGHM